VEGRNGALFAPGYAREGGREDEWVSEACDDETRPRHGRHSKLTPWREKRILDAVAAHASLRVRAGFAGIDVATLKRWMARGRAERAARLERDDPNEEPTLYEGFVERVEQAEVETELRALGHITLAGQRDWRAFAWVLERRHPEDYGRYYAGPQPSALSADDLARAILRAKAEVQASVPKAPSLRPSGGAPDHQSRPTCLHRLAV
jgi:hypothetical protein